MKLVKPSFEIIEIMAHYPGYEVLPNKNPLGLIEIAGRVCYKSEHNIDSVSRYKFIKSILKRGHESVIEHSAMTVKFICDRGVTHELVRHRLCAFSQESTRYCNYKDGVTFVIPPWIDIKPGEYAYGDYIESDEENLIWLATMWNTEKNYIDLLSLEWSPQQARSVLPNSLKTEIVVTANFREWRHIFKLRCSPAAHPQMREIMIPLLKECRKLIPVIFDDISLELLRESECQT